MKHTLYALTLILFGFSTHAQEGFKLGIQGGLPLGDFNDEVSLFVGADVGYMWALGEVVDLGATAGFIHGFAETFQEESVSVDLPNVQFLPLAASIRIWPSNSFSFGINAGTALGINDGNDGGLYYRPIVGFLLGPQTELNLSYTGIQLDERTWTSANLGVIYTFPSERSR
ncbi:hypothetical protein [Ulvibacterium sp.]|uniref:hypothetical protein n=1 Tax=Ulvibacterium sp. TaxID=2665914 RepID=UPI002635FAD9|nr:hypothetical protein [Ulvibacterium sp.]